MAPKSISDGAVEALGRMEWSGNVRELRNIVERLVIMSVGDRIEDVAGALQGTRGGGEVEDILAKYLPSAFYSIEDVKGANAGVFRGGQNKKETFRRIFAGK